MAKKIRVWDGTQWQDVAPSLPYTAIHSAQASMPLTGVDGQVWLDTDGTLAGQDFVPLSGGTMTGNLNVPSINSGPIVGRNKILNGDFSIWQRGTSITAGGTGYFYHADRFQSYSQSGASSTVTRQTFTPGSAPVAGYEGQFFARVIDTANICTFSQRIEDVRTLAGQNVTFSFWAKSASNVTGYATMIQQFGSGGSSLVYATINSGGSPSFTNTWQRFTVNATLPSVAGKTIGSGSNLFVEIGGGANNALDTWGWQLEAGNQATPFHTATPNQQTELAACQRYYYRIYNPNGGQYNAYAITGVNSSTTTAAVQINFPVKMRVKPSLESANSGWYVYRTGGNFQGGTWSMNTSSFESAFILYTTSGLVVNDAGIVNQNNAGSDTAYFGFSAEL